MSREYDPHEEALKVNSRADLVSFLERLSGYYKDNPEQLENDRTEAFLEALSGFLDDIEGYYQNAERSVDAEFISWQMIAEALSAATIYE